MEPKKKLVSFIVKMSDPKRTTTDEEKFSPDGSFQRSKSHDSGNKKTRQQLQLCSRVRFDRPKLQWDFVNLSQYPVLGGPRIHVAPLAQQERQLVEDILNCFLGFSGYYIEPVSLNHPKGDRQFIISPQVNAQLLTLAEKILPLPTYYFRIMKFIQDNHVLNAGRVNQALSHHLDEEMQEFCQQIAVMEDKFVAGTITLPSMWSDLHKFQSKMETLHQIALCSEETRGGSTLEALHETITYTMADQRAQQIFCRAAKAGSEPYFESLESWIYKGVIDDPFDEFMIVEKTAKRDPNQWDNIFAIDYDCVPSFLYKAAERIHSAGKYLDAIRNSLSFEQEMPSMIPEKICYDFFDPSYLDQIRVAHEYANSEILRLLVVDSNIIGKLRTVKAVFCLEFGDIFSNIIENCSEELKKPAHRVCQSHLPSLFRYSLRASSVKRMPHIEDIDVYIEKRTLLRQTLNVSHPEFALSDDENQSGFESLTLKIASKWPDCLILHEKAVKCYQMLFRELFGVKLTLQKVAQTHLRVQTKNQGVLKHCVLTFLSSCLSFMTQGTIEKYWTEFERKAAAADTVEELRNCHDDFLYKVMTRTMLTTAGLYEKFQTALTVCSSFSNDLSDDRELAFSEAVDDLISAINDSDNFPGRDKLIALLRPTVDYTSSSRLSVNSLTESSQDIAVIEFSTAVI